MPKQLLIADDSYLVRETIKNVLAGRTDVAVCGEASNGLEAVEKAKTLKPDLIQEEKSHSRTSRDTFAVS
jgi:chemotaxis response regulator CheB